MSPYLTQWFCNIYVQLIGWFKMYISDDAIVKRSIFSIIADHYNLKAPRFYKRFPQDLQMQSQSK